MAVRMPRARFTVRRLIVAVMLIAALLGAFEADVDGSALTVGGEPSRFRP